MPNFTVEMVNCPECTATAEVLDRFVLDSTDGPVEHTVVLCVLRHRRTVLMQRLTHSLSAADQAAVVATG